MYESDKGKPTFMTEQENYQYNDMPLGLKKVEIM